MSNYPLKIIHLFNLVNTFYKLFRHICMSPDSLDSHMKILPWPLQVLTNCFSLKTYFTCEYASKKSLIERLGESQPPKINF